jgi:preprotein translocase subunit SecA
MANFLQSLFSANQREVDRLARWVGEIQQATESIEQIPLQDVASYTTQLKQRFSQGAPLDELLPEAFALVRHVSQQTIGLRHFDVQLMGGVILHQGKIAEMKTGEGKTLVATLPAYLNALAGEGVHIVTVNDYLARRDRDWMGPVFHSLGLSTGFIVHDTPPVERKAAYQSDITYGTNNEFGFDYLRDNMAISAEQTVQRPLHYAIVDEVDSILIDEARTPLIISGPAEESTDLYYRATQIARRLVREEDYSLDEKSRTAALTVEGAHKVERYFGLENLFSSENVEYNRHILVALRALHLFRHEVDYIVKDGEVIIVDEFTGRMMFGRRYSDGLHQAIEAKEGLRVRQENQTLATITFQNYFRMYKKLAGMTGTAATEEDEFKAIYNLPVVIIPTNKSMIRVDAADSIYKTEKAKFQAIVEQIKDLYAIGQPILVGTRSIEKSELLSRMLLREGIAHQVLNAKYHEKEAQIIALAGQEKAVTIATNMAGRGVDIVLGSGVVDFGGLQIIGTERHESRRIDNQLRGRSGRQGDPGASRFYLSLEDELLRLFGGAMLTSLMDRLRVPEDMPIEHGLLTKAIENAQKKVEARNFEIRKELLEYDNVLNKQREVIYAERRKILEKDDLREHILEMMDQVVTEILGRHINEHAGREQWDLDGYWNAFAQLTGIPRFQPPEAEMTRKEILAWSIDTAQVIYQKKETEITPDVMRKVERYVLLQTVDSKWKDHLYNMDYLKEGIGLRAYGQKSPLLEYQLESFEMFQAMLRSIQEDTVKFLVRVRLQASPEGSTSSSNGWTHQQAVNPQPSKQKVRSPDTARSVDPPPALPARKHSVGRNDPCPCGSGKKYKRCHGKNL